MIYLDNKHEMWQYVYNICDRSHPHTYLLLALEQNIKTDLNQLLDHFRRSLDCTEHVQQAVKPLGYP